jgi:signal transduction histidine kinase
MVVRLRSLARAAVLAVLLPADAESLRLSLSYSLEPRYSFALLEGGYALAADFDKDGSDEILCVGPSEAVCIALAGASLVPLWHSQFQAAGESWDPIDITSDGRPELVVTSESHAGDAWITLYQAGEDQGLRLGPFLKGCRPGYQERTGEVVPLGGADLDGDGRSEMVVASHPFARGVEPKRLWAFDGTTGRVLWTFDLGPSISEVHLLHREEDRGRQLLLGTYADGNGFRANATSDSTSYVICLSPRGETVWSTPFGGCFSGTHLALADVDGDGETDVVVGSRKGPPGSGDQTTPAVVVLDPATGTAKRKLEFRAGVASIQCFDLEPDGRSEILALAQDQNLYCLGGDLRLRWRTARHAYEWLVGAADLDADGSQEIVALSGPGFAVLDSRGRQIASARRGSRPRVSFARVAGRTWLLTSADGYAQLLGLEAPLSLAWPLGAGVLASTGAGALALRRHRRQRQTRAARSEQAHRSLLEAMTAFGHAGASLKVLDRIRYWLLNWNRVDGLATLDDTPLPRLASEYVERVQLELLALARLAGEARVPPADRRHLPQWATSVGADLAPLQHEHRLDGPRRRRLLDRLEDIDGSLRAIRSHLRRTYHVPLAGVVRQAIDRREVDLQQIGARVEQILEAPSEPVAFVAASVLETVLDGLLDNSIRAMQGRPQREVEIRIGSEGAHCWIDVRDSGCGIPADDWERAFDRSYTTKEDGGGYGLHFAREALARFEGRIFVVHSDAGEGTTFRVTLRTAEAAVADGSGGGTSRHGG